LSKETDTSRKKYFQSVSTDDGTQTDEGEEQSTNSPASMNSINEALDSDSNVTLERD
jgi:hypothetical protein